MCDFRYNSKRRPQNHRDYEEEIYKEKIKHSSLVPLLGTSSKTD